MAADLELELAAGGRTSLPTLRKITDRMADLLARALGLKPEDELLRHVRTPGSSWFVPPRRVRRVCFSGGVADCIGRQGGEDVPYGDIGVLLGRSIAANPDLAALPRLEAAETIRATVVGGGHLYHHHLRQHHRLCGGAAAHEKPAGAEADGGGGAAVL